MKLRTGAFARVAFRNGVHEALNGPPEALTTFGLLDRVFVVEKDRAASEWSREARRRTVHGRDPSGLAERDNNNLPARHTHDASPVAVKP